MTNERYIVYKKDIEIAYFDYTFDALHNVIACSKRILDTFPCPVSLLRVDSVLNWVNSRVLAGHRMNVSACLTYMGVKDTFDLINRTHSVSLNDTYWVKLASDPVTWKDVSPYKQPLNKQVSNYALNAKWANNLKNNNITPEFTTGGNVKKCWVKDEKGVSLIKQGFDNVRWNDVHREPYSEFYAMQIAESLGEWHVRYTINSKSKQLYTKCPCFTSENESLITVPELFQKYGYTCNSIAGAFKLLKGFDIFELEQSWENLLIFNCLTLRSKFTLADIGIIYSANTMQFCRLAPIYGNSGSLVPYFMTEANLKRYIEHNTLEQLPTGEHVVTLARKFLSINGKKRLKELSEFEFEQRGRYNLPKERLDILSGLVRSQAKWILQK